MNRRDSSLCSLALALMIGGCDTADEDTSDTDPTGSTASETADSENDTDTMETGFDTTGGQEPATSSSGTDDSTSGEDPTTGEVPSDVNPPCIDARLGVVLPEEVVAKADASIYAQTAVEARDDIAATVVEIGGLPFPDASAVVAEVDDLTVFEGDIAYTWGEYLYVGNGDGYSIYRDDGGLLPDEILFVDQDAACSSFSLSHYAFEGDPSGAEPGDTVLFFSFDQAGTAKDFGWSRWGAEDIDFTMREFEDLSGDFQRNVNDQADLSLGWNAVGEGTFTRFEDGAEVESDLW